MSSNDYDEFLITFVLVLPLSLLHPFSVDQLCYVWICCLWFSWLASPSMLNTRSIRLLSTSWFYWIVLQCNLFPELSCFRDFLIWHGMSHEFGQGVASSCLSFMPPHIPKEIVDDEELLQAVVLADSFNKRFRPLTSRKPRVRFSKHFARLCSDHH